MGRGKMEHPYKTKSRTSTEKPHNFIKFCHKLVARKHPAAAHRDLLVNPFAQTTTCRFWTPITNNIAGSINVSVILVITAAFGSQTSSINYAKSSYGLPVRPKASHNTAAQSAQHP